jgi:spermidine/putrescine transport system substrate-binding protein
MSNLVDRYGAPISRRRFIQGCGAVTGATMLAASPFRSALAQNNVLNILTWPGHGDPFAVAQFEEMYNCTVQSREYEGGEQMLGLVNQSPADSFDVIMADAEYVSMLRDGGFIDALDPADYPIDDFFPEFQKFEGHWLDDELYSVMIRFGYIGMAYRTDVLSEDDVRSYSVLWNEKVRGRVGFFDWYLPSMGCISLYEGNSKPFDLDDAALQAVKERMFTLGPQIGGFYGMASMFSMLTNGTAAVIPGIGDWVVDLLKRDGVPVAAVVPKEGGLQWTESLSIASGSKNKELAKAFIQYMSSPEGQVRTARLPAYTAAIPNRKGWELMNEEYPEDAKMLRLTFTERNVMDEYADGLINVRRLPVQQDIGTWNDIWSNFKTI